jgi:hypothetical protein
MNIPAVGEILWKARPLRQAYFIELGFKLARLSLIKNGERYYPNQYERHTAGQRTQAHFDG